MNARRHGLASRLTDIPEQLDKLELLAGVLSQGSVDLLVAEQSRIIAECHLELRRVRAVQRSLFHDVFQAQMGDLRSPASAMVQILRYSTRAVSRRKKALNKLFAVDERSM